MPKKRKTQLLRSSECVAAVAFRRKAFVCTTNLDRQTKARFPFVCASWNANDKRPRSFRAKIWTGMPPHAEWAMCGGKKRRSRRV